MSTNSVIAVPDGDVWRGRYVHWDGYPQWMAEMLCALVTAHGVGTVRTTLVEAHQGWASIDRRLPDISDVAPDPDAEVGEPGYFAHVYGPGGMFASGTTVVPGWGVAYPDKPTRKPKSWITPTTLAQAGWIEWVYILSDSTLFVHWVDHDGDNPVPVLVGAFAYDADVDWVAVEDAVRTTRARLGGAHISGRGDA